MIGTDAKDPPKETFEAAAKRALESVRAAMREAIASIGADRINSLALSRLLRVDKSLSWRIVRFAQEPDVFVGGEHLPGDPGLRILTRALRGSHASHEAIERLDDALAQLSQVVREHAGTRTAFRAMLLQCRRHDAHEDATFEFRRMAFQANAALWGIDVATRSMMTVISGSRSKPGFVDIAMVGGFTRLRRMRHDLAWPVARRRFRAPGADGPPSSVRPLDPSVDPEGPPLVGAYSTIPPAALRPVKTSNGAWYELPETGIGSANEVSLVIGEHYEAIAPVVRTTDSENAELMIQLDLPIETLVFDLYVERALPLGRPVTARLFSQLLGGSAAPSPERERDALPMAERPVQVDDAEAPAATQAIPRFAELVEDVFAWLGRARAGYDHFRLEIRYPMMPTALVMALPLAEP